MSGISPLLAVRTIFPSLPKMKLLDAFVYWLFWASAVHAQ